MAKYQVTAPEPAYGGTVGGVQFTDGKAVIDDDTNPGELAYCRAQGYGVEPVEEAKPEKAPRKPPAKPAVKTPEVKTPEVKTPEVKTPEVKTPEVKTPDDDKKGPTE